MRKFLFGAALMLAVVSLPAQQMVTETFDPAQPQDPEFAKLVKEWTGPSYYMSPLVDHLPLVKGIPTPKDVLGYYIGAPYKLTYYADILKYYRALAAATPRVKVETIGTSDEGRELAVIWVSSEQNIKNLQQNRANLAKLADPRGLSQDQIRQLVAATKPNYHFMGGLHSGETGPSEMLMELCYRLATETSPLVKQIRDNVIVSITPVADPDGRDRNLDWFYQDQDLARAAAARASSGAPQTASAQGEQGGRGSAATGAQTGRGAAPSEPPQAAQGPFGGRGGAQLPYWGKYVYHDNNRDINLSNVSMKAIVDWYYTAHPPIMHDLHEAEPLLYDYSGGPPQNPNLDPILFFELPFFADYEVAQMTKYGMPGVYTHAFMDGWSPGYLGSVAYNHNGMMRMYETQSGVEPRPDAAARGQAGRGGRGARGAAPEADRGTAASEQGGRGGRAGRGGAPGGPEARGGERGFGPTIPTGRGGSQLREWYRGLPIPPNAVQTFSRRDNTNYMETAVLLGLQITSMFPNMVLQNFYEKTEHSIDDGKTKAPYGFVVPAERDMTRAALLVNILRAQGIEVGQTNAELKTSGGTFPAGSYVVKLDQPYGRLAKNLLELQDYPDPNLQTYDDSGWTMGLSFNVPVKEIKDKVVLDAAVTPVKEAVARGKVTGAGGAGFAIAHYGSNNMIAFRYRFKDVPMKIAEKDFKADGADFPAGSFVIGSGADASRIRSAVEEFGLTAAALDSQPVVPMHDANVPRIAIYSSWNGTQDLGWYRLTFDKFGIPYDLIYKERVDKGNLRNDYDVIVMPTQQANRLAIFAPHAAQPVPYEKTDKFKFLGMYGESPDITGGMGGEGVDAFAKFLDAGGTLICTGQAVQFPAEVGLARTVDASGTTSRDFYAPRPIINADIVKTESPVFYGYTDKVIPVKYLGGPLMSVGQPDQNAVLARYPGGESNVLSGLMRGADEIRNRPFAIEVPGGFSGKGRVLLFSNNPIYRWQNHGEFNMVFNSILNWDDFGGAAATPAMESSGRR
jgi:hypothetical protein